VPHGKGGAAVNALELSRLEAGLRLIGLDGEQTADFLLWVFTGEDQYEPKPIP